MVAAIWKYPKLHTRTGRALAWYVCFKFVFEIVFFLTAREGKNNSSLVYLYSVIEVTLLTYLLLGLYYLKTWHKMIRFGGITVLCCIILEAIINWPLNQINTVSRVLEAVFLFGTYAFALTRIPDSPHWSLLFDLPEFWIGLAIMIFFSGHLVVALFSNYVLIAYDNVEAGKLWIINSVANTVSNTFLLCGLMTTLNKAS